jgi:capsular polysaccharide biosynthesis protein
VTDTVVTLRAESARLLRQGDGDACLGLLRRIEPLPPGADRDRLITTIAEGLYTRNQPAPARIFATRALALVGTRFGRMTLRQLLLRDPGLDLSLDRLVAEINALRQDQALPTALGRDLVSRLARMGATRPSGRNDRPRDEGVINAAIAALDAPEPIPCAESASRSIETTEPATIPAPGAVNELVTQLSGVWSKPVWRPDLKLMLVETVELRKNGGALAVFRDDRLLRDLFNETGIFETRPDPATGITTHGDRPAILTLDIHPSPNYCHWLFDGLPRVALAMEQFDLRPGHFDVVVERAPGFVVDSLAALGIPRANILETGKAARIRFRWLYVSTSSFLGLRHPAQAGSRRLLEMVRDRLLSGLNVTPAANGAPVFLSRTDATKRRLVNEDEVAHQLEPMGVRFIAPGTLTFPDQVALASRAPMLLGPHGAGLSNLLFLPRGAHVAEIFPPRYGTSSFYVPAAVLGLRYFCMKGLAAGEARAGQLSGKDDFRCEAGELADFVRRVLTRLATTQTAEVSVARVQAWR